MKKKYTPRPKSDFEKRLFKRFEEPNRLKALEKTRYKRASKGGFLLIQVISYFS